MPIKIIHYTYNQTAEMAFPGTLLLPLVPNNLNRLKFPIPTNPQWIPQGIALVYLLAVPYLTTKCVSDR